MLSLAGNRGVTKTTSYKVVWPFYAYAAICFLAATIFLLADAPSFTKHYFQPHTLAITHIMALGWGTMIVLGASHQLVPVLTEGKLHSDTLAYITFILAAVGIPLLVYAFYVFDMGRPAQWGGGLVVAAIIVYLVNLAISISKSKKENVHAVFVFTATAWLLVTTSAGLILVCNFTFPLLTKNLLDYLPLHAHLGIVGWFLLMVTGVGSRLIPMFLISQYNNTTLLWWIYSLINGGLAVFVFIYIYDGAKATLWLPVVATGAAVMLFGYYGYQSYRQRIRKRVDEQMKISLLSVCMMLLPVLLLVIIIAALLIGSIQTTSLTLAYGFVIFFGWITAIIVGMTFKTLPFIVWNKVYHHRAAMANTPNPKDIFNSAVFRYMSVVYLAGFILFTTGIFLKDVVLLQSASVLLLLSAVLYNWNVLKILTHKPVSL